METILLTYIFVVTPPLCPPPTHDIIVSTVWMLAPPASKSPPRAQVNSSSTWGPQTFTIMDPHGTKLCVSPNLVVEETIEEQ